MSYIWKVLLVVAWSAFKYVMGLGTAIGFGFNQIEILIFNVGGGMLGVVIYLYTWDTILKIWHKFYPRKPKQIKFTKLKRKIVVFIKKYEVWGIALLTPILFSVPIGTILAATIEPNKWRIKLIMFASFCFWTLLILAFKLLLRYDLDKLI